MVDQTPLGKMLTSWKPGSQHWKTGADVSTSVLDPGSRRKGL